MPFKKFIILLLFYFISAVTFCQVTDLARVEYTFFPQSNSDNSFRRFRTFVNVPISLGDGAYFVPGVEYRNIELQLGDPLPFSKTNLEHYESFTLRLGYTNKMKNDWRFALQSGMILASNFESGITSDDFIVEGAVYFIKDKTSDLPEKAVPKPWRLILGLNYSTTAGRPFPLPIINYYREFKKDWSFSLGVPKSNVKYTLSQKSKLQAYITLDGFFANIQSNVQLQGGQVGENISFTTVLSGLGYEYSFTKHLLFYIYTGHTILNDIRIRDRRVRDVFTINDVNTFYARGGIKFKI